MNWKEELVESISDDKKLSLQDEKKSIENLYGPIKTLKIY